MGASESQEEPQSQSQPQAQPQLQQHHHEGKTKPSNSNSTKAIVDNNATAVKSSETRSMMPHEYEHILKDADSPLDKSCSREKLLDLLYAGVFLDHKTKASSIGSMTELAELKRVCWFEVEGKFDTRNLSQGILYRVSFIVMLKIWAEGWDIPINVRLDIPGEKKQEHRENLMEISRESWIEIPVGEFVSSEKHVGEMKIHIYEYGGMWKTGLLIKGILIKPKN
ncbi:hypothetical protein Fmac_005968 [Flemingia macrophylla]|uniref:Uncharacterized protein n=1 Tax=Flemingia macrophylla TaxID=520843 RepID=A0ABD1N990_9FABA